MYPVLAQIGTFELRSYGIIVVLSFFLGLWLSVRQAKRSGLDPALVQDFAFYALLGGIAGARIYYVVFSNPAYFLQRPWEIVAVWRFADTLAPGVALVLAATAGFYLLGKATGSQRKLRA